MGPDWADGDYDITARQIEPIARRVVDRLSLEPGSRVLDVGCGTGNAALLAARAGAAVTAADPSEGLLDRARERAAAEGLHIDFLCADAEGVPAGGGFDAVLSVFAAIFAPDAPAAVRAMLAASRCGGTVAITTWVPEGAISDASGVVAEALPGGRGATHRWGDAAWAADTFLTAGASQVAIDASTHVFRHESPEAWFAETEAAHPFWRWARRSLGESSWASVRRDSVAALHAGNEDPAAFATTSPWLLVRATA